MAKLGGCLRLAAALSVTLIYAGGAAAADAEGSRREAIFDWFRYEGDDPMLAPAVGEGLYQNPILLGFYPDPSIEQVGGDYYLVNSTFCFFPGIPVFHSPDLVSWTQIGDAIDRPGMLDCSGIGLSRGVFAPTIEEHNGVFHIANTCVDCGGNFIVTTRDPAGPWSDPIWINDVGGIDPSLFFDNDGRVYLMNNDAPPSEPRYDGHRAIWIREVDPQTFQPISEPRVLIDGGVNPAEKPIWIEGPHIYRKDGWYYLSAAEGGTAEGHSQVVLRSRNVLGPYEPNPDNPILTQRDLPRDRPHPVTSVGHADYVQDGKGDWWAVFLGVRPYEGDYYNTGRETFLLPVDWRDGWPVILERGEPVPYINDRPALAVASQPPSPTAGDFSVVDAFDGDTAPPYWLSLRSVDRPWARLHEGALRLLVRDDVLGAGGEPSFLGRRQQHQNAVATTVLKFAPSPGEEAGLAVIQGEEYYYAIGVRSGGDGASQIVVRRRAGPNDPSTGEVLAESSLGEVGAEVFLKIEARGDAYSFFYSSKPEEWTPVLEDADGRLLSTRTAGGFVGALFGLYAQAVD